MKKKQTKGLYGRIRQILEAARTGVARTVNTTQVVANWLIGREIVEEEQRGKRKAHYGERLIVGLSEKLQKDYGNGYSTTNLKLCRQFYLNFPNLIRPPLGHALRDQFVLPEKAGQSSAIGHTPCDRSWKAGRLHANLAWSLYRHLLRVERPESRAFYEIEAIKNNWSARELERQINSLLYERLALSRDKKGVLRLAKKGQQIQRPLDVFKDPIRRPRISSASLITRWRWRTCPKRLPPPRLRQAGRPSRGRLI